jgi:hypothetical protein
MDDQQPTLLIDEVDTFLKDKEKGELRGALNGGHLKGGQYLRCEGEKSKRVRGYGCFGAVAMAGINRIPATLEDRSVVLVLRRKKAGEKVVRFRSHNAKELDDLRRMAARWVQDNEIGLANHEPRIPQGIEDRAADNWEPLLTIADLAGGDWPDRARQIAKKLTRVQAEDDDSINTMLLHDLRGIFDGQDKLGSAEICQRLHNIEGRPWNDWGRPPKPINPNQLARLLKPFLITPSKVRNGAETHQGYHRDQFIDAWDRYLPPDPPSQPEQRNKPQKPRAESVPVSNDVPEHDHKPEHRDPQQTAKCSVVPLQRGVREDLDTVASEEDDGDAAEREAIEIVDGERPFDPVADLPAFLDRGNAKGAAT